MTDLNEMVPRVALESVLQLERCAHARTETAKCFAEYNYAGSKLTEAKWQEQVEDATNRGVITHGERASLLRGDFDALTGSIRMRSRAAPGAGQPPAA